MTEFLERCPRLSESVQRGFEEPLHTYEIQQLLRYLPVRKVPERDAIIAEFYNLCKNFVPHYSMCLSLHLRLQLYFPQFYERVQYLFLKVEIMKYYRMNKATNLILSRPV